MGTEVPGVCRTCFQRFCWDGTTNETVPAPYEPGYKVGEVKVTSAAATAKALRGSSLVVAVVAAVAVGALVLG